MLKVFKTLEVILRRYSKLPVKQLIDYRLHISFITDLSYDVVSPFLTQLTLSKGEFSVFLKDRRSTFLIITITHRHYFDLAQSLQQNVDGCIVVDNHFTQLNNILYFKQSQSQNKTKSVILNLGRAADNENLLMQMDAYLSIVELFHGHLHLVCSSVQASSSQELFQLYAERERWDDDLLEAICQKEGFLKVLQERASKVSLSELSECCCVTGTSWGETFQFNSGSDGVLVWFTTDYLPELSSPVLSCLGSKEKIFVDFLQGSIGYSCYTARRKHPAEAKTLKDLQLSVVIFNCRKGKAVDMEYVADTIRQIMGRLRSQVRSGKEEARMEHDLQLARRLSEMLSIDNYLLVRRLFLR